MSMNIVLYAKKGKSKDMFDIIQTPTEITFRIFYASNKIQEYKNYILERISESPNGNNRNWLINHMAQFNLFIDYYKMKKTPLYWEIA